MQHLAHTAEIAEPQHATSYADAPRLQNQLRQHGIAVAEEPHRAAQRPYLERSRDRDRAYARGDYLAHARRAQHADDDTPHGA